MKGISSVKSKWVYLFGGSTGIGLELAKQMAMEGANILIFARTEYKLISAVEEINALDIPTSTTIDHRIVDISNKEQVDAVIDDCIRQYDAPDILVNCAGRAYPHYFEDVTYEQFNETMKVNLYGVWNTCAAAVPHMKEKGGFILNTSSLAGFIGVFGMTDYAASKFAIIGFSEALRSELARFNIGVSVLCPPDTETPGFETENKTKPPETRKISEGAGILSATAVAKSCFNGMKKGKKVIVPGFDGKMTYYAKRFFPGIVDWVMNRNIRSVQ